MTTAGDVDQIARVPGDAFGIRRAADTCGDVANAAREAAQLLRRVDERWAPTLWSGPFAAAFRDRVRELPPDLARLSDSFGEVADAVGCYATELAKTQEMVGRQRRIAHDHLARADQARASARAQRPGIDTLLRSLRSMADDCASSPDDASLQAAFQRANASYHAQCARYDAALERAGSAQSDLDSTLAVIASMQAALADDRRRCVARIRYASSIGIKNRPGWRVALDAVGAAAKVVTKAAIEALAVYLDALSTIASVVSIAALAIAIVAPVTAEVTLPVSAIAGVISSLATFGRAGLSLAANALNERWGAGYIQVTPPSKEDMFFAALGLVALGQGGTIKVGTHVIRGFKVLGPSALISDSAELGRAVTRAATPVYRQLSLWEAAPRVLDRVIARGDRIRRTIVTGWRAGLDWDFWTELPETTFDIGSTVQKLRELFGAGGAEVHRPVPALDPSCSRLPRYPAPRAGWAILARDLA
jgi:hypothetical protein